MNKLLFHFLVVLLLGSTFGHAQVITPVASREAVLSGMRTTLGNVDNEVVDYSQAKSPFVIRKMKEPEALSKDLDSILPGIPRGEPLADEVALRVIGEQFKPFGSLVLGDRGVLQLANGRTIAKGDTFKAEIQGVIYEILISEVTRDGYQLSLGTATVKKTFFTTTGINQ